MVKNPYTLPWSHTSRSIVRQAMVNNAKLKQVSTDTNHGEAIREDSQSFLCSVPYAYWDMYFTIGLDLWPGPFMFQVDHLWRHKWSGWDHLCRHIWFGWTTYVPRPNILLQYTGKSTLPDIHTYCSLEKFGIKSFLQCCVMTKMKCTKHLYQLINREGLDLVIHWGWVGCSSSVVH